jgi:hypothetical protein
VLKGALVQQKWVRVLAVAVGLVVLISACSSDSRSPASDDGRVVEVTYQVISEMASAEITYTYNGGNDIFRDVEDLPFEKSFDMKVGDIVDLGVKTDGSTATCRVLVDGKKYLESTETNGKFPVCQGRVPADAES